MANIEVVIKIPEEVKNRLCFGVTYSKDIQVVCEALNNSTPLPKGHGRLSDVDWILNKMSTTDAQPITPNEHYAWDFAKALLRKAPTVIEADKEEEE